MSDEPWSAAQRESLLARRRHVRAAYNAAVDEHADGLEVPRDVFIDGPSFERAKELRSELAAVDEEYFRRLPRVAMGACPLCARPLYRTFDAFGLDGLWWRSDAQPAEPLACRHFCVLLGAVDVSGRSPAPLEFEVHPGPGAPFVVPRLLAMPDVVAVISEIPMEDGGIAYPIAYFAPQRPPVQLLSASWARTTFVYTTQLGEHAWRRADEPPSEAAIGPEGDVWEFDLEPWLSLGRIRWCAPGGDRLDLAPVDPAICPFVGRRGARHPQVLDE